MCIVCKIWYLSFCLCGRIKEPVIYLQSNVRNRDKYITSIDIDGANENTEVGTLKAVQVASAAPN